MEVPEESFHWSSWDLRTCYPQRAFIQGLTDDFLKGKGKVRNQIAFSQEEEEKGNRAERRETDRPTLTPLPTAY